MNAGDVFLLILAMSVVTMGSRVLGFLAVPRPRGALGRALHYLPFGLFAAIVVTGTPTQLSFEVLPYLAAVAVTAVSARRGAPIILSLVFGLAAAWLVRFAL